jgi:hypothetical protein
LNTKLIYNTLLNYGLTPQEAKDRFFFVDEYGLVTKARMNIDN